MTAKQAEAKLQRNYPTLKDTDLVLWANIVNLFEQIEGAGKKPCKVFQIKAVAPISVRHRKYEDHKENIPF